MVPGNPESHPHLRRRQTEGGPHWVRDRRRSRSGSPTTSISTIFPERALGALITAIANINVWNRFNVTTRQVAGAFRQV